MDIKRIRAWVETTKRTHLADSAAIEAWHILGAQCRF